MKPKTFSPASSRQEILTTEKVLSWAILYFEFGKKGGKLRLHFLKLKSFFPPLFFKKKRKRSPPQFHIVKLSLQLPCPLLDAVLTDAYNALQMLIYSNCLFPWCKYFCCGQIPAIHVTSLNVELRKDEPLGSILNTEMQ